MSAARRLLGPSERLVWLLDRACSWNFLVHARVQGPLDQDILSQALGLALARHPLLGARILRKGFGKAAFEIYGQDGIPLRVKEAGEEALAREAESELHAPFDTENGPLARAVLIRHASGLSTVMAVFHHAIGDAMSGVFFLQDLMGYCAGLMRGRAEPGAPLPLCGPLESFLPPAGAAGFFKGLGFVAGLAAQKARMGKGALPRLQENAGPEKRQARVFVQEIAPDQAQRLVQKARGQGASVHGALAAACMAAIAQENKGASPLPFYIASDVSLRQRLARPVGEAMGFYITGVLTAHWLREDAVSWDLAREMVQSLRLNLDKDAHLYGARMLRDTGRLVGVLGTGRLASGLAARYMDALNPGVIVLSNIGNVRVETGAPFFSVNKVGFASSLSATASFGVHAATCEGTLSLSFVGMEPMHAAETTGETAERAVRELEALARTS